SSRRMRNLPRERSSPCSRPVPGACCSPDAGARRRPCGGMMSMTLIRQALALILATATAALVTVAVGACGGATTATGPPTNGLEKKSPADVLQAAAALQAAKSVHIAGTGPKGHLDARIQH